MFKSEFADASSVDSLASSSNAGKNHALWRDRKGSDESMNDGWASRKLRLRIDSPFEPSLL